MSKIPTIEEFFTRNGLFIVKDKSEIKKYAELVRAETLKEAAKELLQNVMKAVKQVL